MAADRPLLGIALMIAFCVLAPVSDGLSKLATDFLPVLQIIALRFLIGAAMLAPLVWAMGNRLRPPAGTFGLIALRSALHVAAFSSLLAALTVLPLAETMAIVFVQPFLMILVARAVMGEATGPRRLAACAAGFAGTLLVIQPTFAEAGWVVVLPLITAVLFTGFMLITRRIAKACDPLALQVTGGLLALPMIAPFLAAGPLLGLPGLTPVMPEAAVWGLILAVGVVGTLAHLLFALSLRFAPAATLAPIQYLELPVIVVVGWVMFRDFPDAVALAGIAVICASGLYIIQRERRIGLAPRPGPRAPHPAQLPAAAPASAVPTGSAAPPAPPPRSTAL